MFWDERDLHELKGTAVVGLSGRLYWLELNSNPTAEKLGKDEANQEYNTKIIPALQVSSPWSYIAKCQNLLIIEQSGPFSSGDLG